MVTMKLWGRLTCYSGKRAKKENRVFFHDFEQVRKFCDARFGPGNWRACKNCHPDPDDCYERVDGKWKLCERECNG